MTVHLYACSCGKTMCLRPGEVLECCLEPQGPGRRRDRKPVAYDEVVVTARVHLAPGADAQMVADWLMGFADDRSDWPEGVGPIDWSFEVVRRED
jgi:hypothetical protein